MAKLFGALLMAVGILVATLCGLCSLAVGGAMLASSLSMLNSPNGVSMALTSMGSMLGLILVFGGIPIIFGVALFYVGRRMSRGD